MRVLVTAASKHGATAEIAEAICDALVRNGLDAMVMPAGSVGPDTILGCDAVVLGSAVYAGHWLEPARTLASEHGMVLALKPVWLFSSGPVGDPPRPAEDPVDASSMLESTGARAHRVFAGRLDRAGLGFAERAIAAALRAPYGDFRDWSEIAAWGDTIARELLAEAR